MDPVLEGNKVGYTDMAGELISARDREHDQKSDRRRN